MNKRQAQKRNKHNKQKIYNEKWKQKSNQELKINGWGVLSGVSTVNH